MGYRQICDRVIAAFGKSVSLPIFGQTISPSCEKSLPRALVGHILKRDHPVPRTVQVRHRHLQHFPLFMERAFQAGQKKSLRKEGVRRGHYVSTG